MLPSPPPPEQKWHLIFSLTAELAGQHHDWSALWWLNGQLRLLGAGSLSILEWTETIKSFLLKDQQQFLN